MYVVVLLFWVLELQVRCKSAIHCTEHDDIVIVRSSFSFAPDKDKDNYHKISKYVSDSDFNRDLRYCM